MSSIGVQSREEDRLWVLICKARSGNKKAAHDLFKERRIFYGTKIIAQKIFRSGIDGDYKDVDDLHQEMLFRLWLRITTFKGENRREFWGWVRAITNNLQKDGLRKIEKEREVFDKNIPEDDISYLEGLCERALTEDPGEQIWINELLGRLDPLERKIFDKYCWEGKTVTEIAEDLGDSPDDMGKSTVHRRLKAIQKKLIEIMGRGKY